MTNYNFAAMSRAAGPSNNPAYRPRRPRRLDRAVAIVRRKQINRNR